MSEAPAASAPWRNRIVGTEDVDPKVLIPNPLNWRKHPTSQQQVLSGVLGELGWIDTVIVNKRTGRMIDGHLRVELALKKHEPTVPVQYVDLTDDEERLALATFDPITAMAGKDLDVIRKLVADLAPADQAVADLLKALTVTDEGASEALAVLRVSIADPEHKPVYGDVWEVGPHVLVIRDVFEDWKHYVPLLKEGWLLLPYAGPFVALVPEAKLKTFVIVQPDTYVAGHILDRYAERHGDSTVRKRS